MIVLRAVIAFLDRVGRSRHLGTPLALRRLPPTIRRRRLIILWRVNLRGTRLTCDQEKRVCLRVLFLSAVGIRKKKIIAVKSRDSTLRGAKGEKRVGASHLLPFRDGVR